MTATAVTLARRRLRKIRSLARPTAYAAARAKKGRTAPRDFLGVTLDTEEKLLKQAIRAHIRGDFSLEADLYDVLSETVRQGVTFGE